MATNLKHADGELALALAHLERGDGDTRRKVEAAKEHLSGYLFESDLPDELRPTLKGIVVVEVGALDPLQLLGLAEEITGLAWVVSQQVAQVERDAFYSRAHTA